MKLVVIGAGQMAKAAAYDFVRNSDVSEVKIISRSRESISELKEWLDSDKVSIEEVDASNKDAVVKALEGFDGAISCVPYQFNFNLAKAALQAGCHFVDLGGNNDVVSRELSLDKAAKDADVLIVPDCGLAPGLVSVLTKCFIDNFDDIEEVRLRVGGLPQNPQPPLNYSLVFSVKGLINEYVEPVTIIKDHDLEIVEPLSFVEDIDFEEFGTLEAFSTSGGTSTMPQTLKNRIKNLDYKTIRYSGHLVQLLLLFDLGLMSSDKIKSLHVSPRDVLEYQLEENLPHDARDLVLVKAWCKGIREGSERKFTFEIVDRFDPRSDLTAMMKMTAFPAATLLTLICSGEIEERGVLTQELFVPAERILDILSEKGIEISTSED